MEKQVDTKKNIFKTTFLNVEYLQIVKQYQNLSVNYQKVNNEISELKTDLEKATEKNEDSKVKSLEKEIEKQSKNSQDLKKDIDEYFSKIKEYEKLFKEDIYIELKDIHKSFGDKEVLKGVDLKVKRGDKISIIGHNGSGKTTLTDIISGVKGGTSGELIYYFGKSREYLGDSIGIQFQKLNYPEGYKVSEIIVFFNRMVNKKIRYTNDELKILIKEFGIDKFYNKTLISLSGGQKQRVNLFLAFIKKPKFLILDELSTGLDIDIYGKVINLFKRYIAENKVTVILISHNLEEIQDLTDKVFLLKEGKIVLEMPSNKLTTKTYYDFIRRNKETASFDFNFVVEKHYLQSRFYKTFIKVKDKLGKNFYETENFKFHIKEQIEEITKEQKNISILAERKDFLEKHKEKFTVKMNEENNKNTSRYEKNLKKTDRKLWKVVSKINKYEDSIFQIKEDTIEIYKNLKIYFERLLKLTNQITNKITASKEELNKEKEYIATKEEIKSDKKAIKSIEADLKNQKITVKDKTDYYQKQLDDLESIPKETPIIFDNDLFKNYDLKQIRIINVKKYFGIKPAVDGVMLNLLQGERVAITGPNGSGKTTLTEILATTLNSTTGKVRYYFGPSKSIAKHEIGMQFQESKFPSDLKVKDILLLFLKTSMWAIKEEELWKLVSIFKLDHILKSNGDILSGGERQRLNVIIALLKRPSLLILDEISTGLDVESIEEINQYIKYYLDQTKANLVLISHNPSEVYRLVDKLIILKAGKVTNKYNVNKLDLKDIRKIFIDIYKDVNTNFINLDKLNLKTDFTETNYNLAEQIEKIQNSNNESEK